MATPTVVLTNFQKQVADVLANYDGLVVAVVGRPRRITMERLVAEQCVLSIAVRWEAFIHDLIIGHIEQSPMTCINFYKNRVMQGLEAKHKGFAGWITLSVPTSLTPIQIEMMLDPTGRNVSADSAETLTKKANDLLAAAHARKFSLTAMDCAFLNFVISLRNYLSHRSRSSKAILGDHQAALVTADPTTALSGSLRSVAIYLSQTPPSAGASRAKLIGQGISALAAKLS